MSASLFPNFSPVAARRPRRVRTGPPLGKEFEQLIELSARCCSRLALEQLPKTGAQFIGGKSSFIHKPIPCDFIGVIDIGVAVFFDAKSIQGENRFKDWNNPRIVKPHQREFLIRMGRAGAVSGVMAEANELAKVFWMPWQVLQDTAPSIVWDDPRLVLVDVVRVGQVLRFQQFVGWAIRNVAS